MDLLPIRWRHNVRRFSCVLLTGGALALGAGLGTNQAHAQFIGQDFPTVGDAGAMTTATGYASGFDALSNVGADAMAIGNDATALGIESTAVGNAATAGFLQSTALGFNSNAGASFTTAIGHLSQATFSSATAVGVQATASNTNATALGTAASASGLLSTAVGTNSMATFDNTTALGESAEATSDNATAIGQSSVASGDDSTALGQGTTASFAGATAVGAGAQATGVTSTALGQLSVASNTNATAIGSGATAAFANSTAIGYGSATTRADQVVIGRSDNTYTAAGITSAASLAAQTGTTQLVTSDSGGNLATVDLANTPAFQSLQSDVRQNTEGVAMAIALGGSGSILPDNMNFAVSTNFGTFQGQNAVGFSGVARLTDHTFLNGGVGTGLNQGTYGGRAGVTFAW